MWLVWFGGGFGCCRSLYVGGWACVLRGVWFCISGFGLVVVCGCVYGCLALWVVGFCGWTLATSWLHGFRNIVLVRCGLRFAFVAWRLCWWP